MLSQAHQLRAQGVEVVLGIVETHGRAETQRLASGLEVVPRRSVEYRGTTLTEFDLDRALARKPAIVLSTRKPESKRCTNATAPARDRGNPARRAAPS